MKREETFGSSRRSLVVAAKHAFFVMCGCAAVLLGLGLWLRRTPAIEFGVAEIALFVGLGFGPLLSFLESTLPLSVGPAGVSRRSILGEKQVIPWRDLRLVQMSDGDFSLVGLYRNEIYFASSCLGANERQRLHAILERRAEELGFTHHDCENTSAWAHPESDFEPRASRSPRKRALGFALGTLLGIGLVALGARLDVEIPGASVPQSLQTLVVVLLGASQGRWWGALTMALYALVGAAGLPVFAGGESGLDVAMGPSAGYLAGFIAAAALMGTLVRGGWARRWHQVFIAALGAHGVVLFMGWIWLSLSFGPVVAWTSGVAPFLVGGAVKSLVASLIIWRIVRNPTKGKGAS